MIWVPWIISEEIHGREPGSLIAAVGCDMLYFGRNDGSEKGVCKKDCVEKYMILEGMRLLRVITRASVRSPN